MNMIERLIEALKDNDKFVSQGKLLKNKIIESGLQIDPEMIGLIYKDEELKKHFFKNIGEITIFDKDKFMRFVSNKEFLPDSFTAFLHESNGLGKPLSRDWNQVYSDLDFQYNNLLIQLRGCYIYASSDNKDIASYLGYGHLKFKYLYGQHQFELMLRDNLYFNSNNRGSIEGEYSYPINNSKNNFWYINGFSGYGASLMDYNHQQNRLGIGLLISR